MQAEVVWQQKMSFTGTADTGFQVPLGAHPAVGGDNDGFRPMELIAIGLAGCTAMDVLSILKKKRQNIHSMVVRVTAERAEEHPKVFTRMLVTYEIEGERVDPRAVDRAIELSVTRYCPAQAMLQETVDIHHTVDIRETIGR